MDNSPASRELAQSLFKKNKELENGLRKLAKSKVASDPTIWLQMRENYENIILEDHNFSEKHEVEFALWQLHYRKIEEFRAHIRSASAASASASASSEGVKAVHRTDRVKIQRTVFKSFLSEAIGFYLELMQKIRSKYGLPMGYISDYHERQVISENGKNKSALLKKGLLSCHQCLVYLGDLARYKGLYGEGDPTVFDHSTASNYYIQATNLWPSSGNPHHQLAILASYTGNEVIALYRYFRSLAVDNPFLTARDNLIIAFEKNRQCFSQLPRNSRVPSVQSVPTRINGKERGTSRGENNILSKDASSGILASKNAPDMFKAFSSRFVRLNGILYTRTSLETFGDIFSLIISDLNELLSSGLEEQLNFGPDASENGVFILRLITILIFTVHNVNKESEDRSYAEILQRSVLVQSAFVAAFEFVGHIVNRCTQLRDVSSSYLLPGIMVFMEWLACNPDIASSGHGDEKQSSARSFYWNHSVNFLNKFLLCGLVSIDGDEDEICFSNMTSYEEDETENRLALWEDFELRGFSPLAPAQLILDFSSNYSIGTDKSKKAKKTRIQRIFAAGRSILHVVRVDQQGIYFNSKLKKFLIAPEYPTPESDSQSVLDISRSNGFKHEVLVDNNVNSGPIQLNSLSLLEGADDEEEVIVFKPAVVERHPMVPISPSYATIHPAPSFTGDDFKSYVDTLSPPMMPPQVALNPHSLAHTHVMGNVPLSHSIANSHVSDSISPIQHGNASTSKWFIEQGIYPSDGKSRNTNIVANEHVSKSGSLDVLPQQSSSFSFPSSLPDNSSISGMPPFQITSPNLNPVPLPGKLYADMNLNLSAQIPTTSRKNPVTRPLRHSGPPPGFSQVQPQKPEYSSSSFLGLKNQNPFGDDYSWLDGYQPPSTTTYNPVNQTSQIPPYSTPDNNLLSATGFPFPSKQIPNFQAEQVNHKEFTGHQLLENLKLYSEKQFQANQLDGPLLEQYQTQSSLFPRRFS